MGWGLGKCHTSDCRLVHNKLHYLTGIQEACERFARRPHYVLSYTQSKHSTNKLHYPTGSKGSRKVSLLIKHKLKRYMMKRRSVDLSAGFDKGWACSNSPILQFLWELVLCKDEEKQQAKKAVELARYGIFGIDKRLQYDWLSIQKYRPESWFPPRSRCSNFVNFIISSWIKPIRKKGVSELVQCRHIWHCRWVHVGSLRLT